MSEWERDRNKEQADNSCVLNWREGFKQTVEMSQTKKCKLRVFPLTGLGRVSSATA